MKKILSFVLAAIMLSATALTGCTGEKGVDKIVLATGGNTGTYYAYGMAMGPILAEKTGIKFDVQSTGASKANIQLIQLGEADMAVVQNDVMYYAYTGTDLFTDAQTQDFAALAVLYPELCQIIATKDSGITTVADLKDKRVSVGDAGSGVEFNAKQILEAYGIDMDKDIQKQNLGFGPSADALKDGKIDAFFCVAGIPTTAITDLAMSKDITVVAVEDEKYQELVSKYGFYTQQVVPKETYNGMTEDVKTVAVMATYIVDKDLPEDVVYNITKAIFENKDAIAKAHTKGLELDIDKAIAGIPAEVPLHAGAAKYYAEEGVGADNTLTDPVYLKNIGSGVSIWKWVEDHMNASGTKKTYRDDVVNNKWYVTLNGVGTQAPHFTPTQERFGNSVPVTNGVIYAALDVRSNVSLIPQITLAGENAYTVGEESTTDVAAAGWRNFVPVNATKGDGTWERVVIEVGNVGETPIDQLTSITGVDFRLSLSNENVSNDKTINFGGIAFFNDKYSARNAVISTPAATSKFSTDDGATTTDTAPVEEPAKEGYVFKGWSSDNGTTLFAHADLTNLPHGAVTYVAIFEEVAEETADEATDEAADETAEEVAE